MYVLYRNVSHRAKSSGRKAEHRQKSASERDTNSIRLTLIYVYRGMDNTIPLYHFLSVFAKPSDALYVIQVASVIPSYVI